MLNEYYRNANILQVLKSSSYLDFIKSQPSIIDRDPGDISPVIPHHTGYIFPRLARKKVDFSAVPLSWYQHSELHQIGQDTFQEKYNISFCDIIPILLTIFIKERL